MSQRIESDSLGEVRVASDRYWGAQTQRSLENFRIGTQKMPIEVIHAFAIVKKAAAIVNCELGLLPQTKSVAIVQAADEVLAGKWDDHFPLVVWQTGSGTQSNMNVNEVLSNRAIEILGGRMGSKNPVHPNDDVNKSQSSNDAFPTAMHVSALRMLRDTLFPALDSLRATFIAKSEAFRDVVKVGRTHMMDATPITLGLVFERYASQLSHGRQALENTLPHLYEIALGGTAVGTGINAPVGYADRAAEVIGELIGMPVVSNKCKSEGMAAHDAMVELSGALRRLACSLMAIANDIRLLASGPRCGIGELLLPENEPGSSIMPGKVNPTQCEAVAMLSAQVIGCDTTVAVACSQGHLELNVFKPVIIFNILTSIRLLGEGMHNFNELCAQGIEPNFQRIEDNLNNSLMLATALNTVIGYDKASQIVKKAYAENTTLKKAAVALGFLTEERFDEVVDPRKMVNI